MTRFRWSSFINLEKLWNCQRNSTICWPLVHFNSIQRWVSAGHPSKKGDFNQVFGYERSSGKFTYFVRSFPVICPAVRAVCLCGFFSSLQLLSSWCSSFTYFFLFIADNSIWPEIRADSASRLLPTYASCVSRPLPLNCSILSLVNWAVRSSQFSSWLGFITFYAIHGHCALCIQRLHPVVLLGPHTPQYQLPGQPAVPTVQGGP